MIRKRYTFSRPPFTVQTLRALLVLGISMVAPLAGQDSRLITGPIDESNLVTLEGNTRPEANPFNDRGRVPDDFRLEHMLLQLKRPPALERALEQYIEQLTDKTSPNFHHWIMPADLGTQYGMSQQDLDTIQAWLQSHGFTMEAVYPTRMVMAFSGTAAQVRQAFHTEIHHLSFFGEQHYANISDPRIPAVLMPAVAGVVSMHDFTPRPAAMPRPAYSYSGCSSLPTAGTAGCHSLVPADFHTIYNFIPAYRQGYYGNGQTIVVLEDSDTYGTDVTTYHNTFLSKFSGSVTTTHPSFGMNTCTDPGATADDSEADLDAEVAMAAAPNAAIQVAACANGATSGVLIALTNLVSAGSPPAIMSISYGECETTNGSTANAAILSDYQNAAAAGVSLFVSSGDAGAASCGPLFGQTMYSYAPIGISAWASTPYNVAVGGTDFEDTYNSIKGSPVIPVSTYWGSTNTPTDGSAKSYIPEIPWNDSCASWLISNFEGYSTTYGTSGFCNSTIASTNNNYLTTGAAGGGPSGCATGTPNPTYYALVNGTCAGYAKPSWQSGITGNPADTVRDIPDVSLFASNGWWGHFVTICFSDTTHGGASCAGAPSTWSGFGGTSIAAPVMAGIQAMVNQRWGTAWQGSPRAGNPAPIYYSIAKTQFSGSNPSACYSINQPPRHGVASACTFYDITQGDIDVDCEANGGANTSNCYNPGGTYGVLTTQSASTTLNLAASGSGYANFNTAPTCTIAVPPNQSSYLSPTGTTIYAGGSTATCTAQIGNPANGGILFPNDPLYLPGHYYGGGSGTANPTLTVGSMTYTLVSDWCLTSIASYVNCSSTGPLIYTYDWSSGATDENGTAQNVYAALMNNPALCDNAYNSANNVTCFTGLTGANTAVTPSWAGGTNFVSMASTSSTFGAGGNFTLSTSAAPTVMNVGNAGSNSSNTTLLTGTGSGLASFALSTTATSAFVALGEKSTSATGTVTFPVDPWSLPGHPGCSGTGCQTSASPTITIGSITYTLVSSSCPSSSYYCPTSGVLVTTYDPSSAGVDEDATAQNLRAAIMNNTGLCYSSTPTCFSGIPGANTSAAASWSANNNYVNLWAQTSGTSGNFSAYTSYSTGITVSGGFNGATPATGTVMFASDPYCLPGHPCGGSGNPNPTLTIGNMTYTLVSSSYFPPFTGANQVVTYDPVDATTDENASAQNLWAAIMNNSALCYSGTPNCFSVTGANTYATANWGPIGLITITGNGNGYVEGRDGCVIGGGGSGASFSAAVCDAVSPTSVPGAYQPAFGANPGWDFATGIGTPNVYNLVFNTVW